MDDERNEVSTCWKSSMVLSTSPLPTRHWFNESSSCSTCSYSGWRVDNSISAASLASTAFLASAAAPLVCKGRWTKICQAPDHLSQEVLKSMGAQQQLLLCKVSNIFSSKSLRAWKHCSSCCYAKFQSAFKQDLKSPHYLLKPCDSVSPKQK